MIRRLLKPGGRGVRPIAIGDVLRRLTSKCCCALVASTAREVLSSHQVGVCLPGGLVGSAVHAARAYSDAFDARGSKVLLKVDFANAFNSIDRTAVLEEVAEHLPGLLPWVTYCYQRPSNLLFGGSIIEFVWGPAGARRVPFSSLSRCIAWYGSSVVRPLDWTFTSGT